MKPQSKRLFVVTLQRQSTSITTDVNVAADSVGEAAKRAVRANPDGWYSRPIPVNVKLLGKVW